MDQRSVYLRRQIVRVLAAARRGHVGSALSIVEILRVLYDDVLRYDARDPAHDDRDRFILSKGHGCLALYVILADKGFFDEEELWKFCAADGLLGGHPETKVPGVEASTGSLGHGLGIGVGMAVHAKREGRGHRTFVLVGDGECNEGSVWEAALFAAKYALDNLTVVVDYNQQQSYASTHDVLELEPLADKWRSFGFQVNDVNGHDVMQLRDVLKAPAKKPQAVICHTVKGKGIPGVEQNLEWHHKSRVSDAEIGQMLSALDEFPTDA